MHAEATKICMLTSAMLPIKPGGNVQNLAEEKPYWWYMMIGWLEACVHTVKGLYFGKLLCN